MLLSPKHELSRPEDFPTEKTCKMCWQTKPVLDFPLNGYHPKSKITKYRPECKACYAKHHKAVGKKSTKKLQAETLKDLKPKDKFIPWFENPERQKYGDMPVLASWGKHFLPHLCTKPFAQFHLETLKDLEASINKSACITRVAPRGFAKSTCFMLYTLFCIYEQKRKFIIIVSKSGGLGSDWVTDMRNEIDSNQALFGTYGYLAPTAIEKGSDRTGMKAKWSSNEFTTTTGVTVRSKGSGSQLRGSRKGAFRPDLIIVDDLEDDEQVNTAEQRTKLHRWFNSHLMPTRDPENSQIVVIGTIIHNDSLIAKLQKEEFYPGWSRREPFTALNEHDKSNWEERFTTEYLLLERARDRRAFEQEYQGKVIADEDRVFFVDDPKRWVYFSETSLDEKQDKWRTICCIDPSMGKTRGDFTGICVLTKTTDNQLLVRELSLVRRAPQFLVDFIIQEWENKWKFVPVNRVYIEDNCFQTMIKDNLSAKAIEKGVYIPIEGITTTRFSKENRIDAMSVSVRDGTLKFSEVIRHETKVIGQFADYPKGNHDDAPDALSLCWGMLTGIFNRFAFNPLRDKLPQLKDLK